MLTTIDKIENYLDCYDNCEEAKSHLTKIHDIAMSSPDADIWTSDDRSDIIAFRRRTFDLLDAIYSIGPALIQFNKKCKGV